MTNNPQIFEKKKLTRKHRNILNTSDALGRLTTTESNSLGFGARCMISGCLPYRKPKPKDLVNGCWIRKDGAYSLWIQGGKNGIPYGSAPRIFIIWLTGEVQKTGLKRINIGRSIREFLRRVGVDSSRGKRGTGRNFLIQTSLLLESRCAFGIETQYSRGGKFLQFSDEYELFWKPQSQDIDDDTVLESYVELTTEFYEEITKHTIPLDLRAVTALKGSPVQLDIYQWLAYRLHYIKPNHPARPRWEQLNNQFGSSYARLDRFRDNFLKQLRSVLCMYPAANVIPTKEGLLLMQSPPPVPKKLMLIKK